MACDAVAFCFSWCTELIYEGHIGAKTHDRMCQVNGSYYMLVAVWRSTLSPSARIQAIDFGPRKMQHYGPWQPCATVTKRFPGLSGSPLLDRLRDTYVVDEDRTVTFYIDESSKRWRFKRHKLNNRGYGHTRRMYQDFRLILVGRSS